MCLIAAGVILQVIMRFFGTSLPGGIEIATFALVGASFLALAHTFRHNVHIRVTMVIGRIGPKRRRYFEIWSLAVSLALSVWFTFYCVGMMRDAYEFGDKSDGLLSIPLWIPQAVMLLGMGLFALSLIEELIRVLRGLKPTYQQRAEAMDKLVDEDETGTVSSLDQKE